MRFTPLVLLLALILQVACVGNPDRQTLAGLRSVEPDMAEVQIDDGIDQAMAGYRKFLEAAPKSTLTPEAMRRLADLKLEKEFGVLGGAERTLPAPESASVQPDAASRKPAPASLADATRDLESRRDFERRVGDSETLEYSSAAADLELPGGQSATTSGPLEAIELYDQILEAYPSYPHNDRVLYQKARAFEELGRIDEAVLVTERLVADYPDSQHIDEVQFRRAEYFFTRKKFIDAEEAYTAIVSKGSSSDYYELALYKLGWTLYKQFLLEEALHQYLALLDYKVSTGYDFDQTHDDADRSRVADTYRVISLCFSDLGGAEAVETFFATNGARSFEDRVYRHLGEFYLEKLRYQDAASVYTAFVDLYPFHRVAPHFSMRVVEIHEAGNFPKLVLESKKKFAADYGLQSDYWRHFDVEQSPDVQSYLKSNLKDLANHYHALYQNEERDEDKPAHFAESARWYQAYLTSFPEDPETPSIHYQLADLLLENREFGAAAQAYEHTAYDYPVHEKASAAGYAAIFAHRENQKVAEEAQAETVRREAVASTIRFVDTFPDHANAAAVLGAAVDDLYALQNFERAIETGTRLIEAYPDSDPAIRRSAWTVIAHSSFDIEAFESSERAYSRVLEMTAPDDESRQGVVDNLAAAIYKQGERANLAEDFRAAADHFLRIAQAAPLSDIRPIAEYDAGAALIRLKDWGTAAAVLEAFRSAYPDHELHREATRQMAFVYREEGNLARAAEEYERVAREAEDSELRREALLVAGSLYEDADLLPRALEVYLVYVIEFTHPIEPSVVTHFKMAEIYQQMDDGDNYHAQLRQIVAIDAAAGDARTEGVRVIAARSALILSEAIYERFAEIDLRQPFEKNLQEKQRRMNDALESLGQLVDYEVGEVTAAATFYMAEVYGNFSRSLIESERPTDLDGAQLQDYEMVLEEEAFPFEERAIEFHEKNLELMAAGVFNGWIEKSLAQLAVVMPGRYAKFESSSGLIESIDRYVYRVPASIAPPESEDPISTTAAAFEGAEDRSEAPAAEFDPHTEEWEPGPAAPDASIVFDSDPGVANETDEELETNDATAANETSPDVDSTSVQSDEVDDAETD